jgi:hypothetical protein
MRFIFLVFVLLLSMTGCSRLYYASMEKIGKEKRDILVNRIIEGRKDQEEAKKQFQTTLEAFQAVTGFQGGKLESVYKNLNDEYEDAASRAKKVSDRIESIDKVGSDLFKEWEAEISSMKDSSLRARSQKILRDTRLRHRQYIRTMRETEGRMQPVLAAFHDQVLFLKHNLNARAVNSLKGVSIKLDTEVAALVKDIEASVAAADAFVASLKTDDAS